MILFKRKRAIILISLLYIFIGNTLFSNDFIFKIIKYYKGYNSSLKPVVSGTDIYTNDDYIIDKANLIKIDSNTGDTEILGQYMIPVALWGNQRLIYRLYHNYDYSIGYFDLDQKKAVVLEKYKEYYSDLSVTHFMQYYQNNQFFFPKFIEGYEDMLIIDMYMFNIETGKMDLLLKDSFPLSISDDKIHVLLNEGRIYRTDKKEVVGRIENIDYGSLNLVDDDMTQIYFLTNDLVISNSALGTKFTNYNKTIVSLDNSFREEHSFYVNLEGEKLISKVIYFTKDLTRALIRTGFEIALVDTTPFRDYLDKKGLLFHPLSALLNDSSVRLRENPNLEAKTLGFLNKGDKVTVLDRSGIKVAIGDMRDYWYKVQTDHGKIGWSYGAFLDLEASETTEPARVNSIFASSTLTDLLDKNMYLPIKAFDNNPHSAWVENTPGPGLGEYVGFELNYPIRVDRLTLMPGWFEKNYWKQYNRVKRLTVQLDDFETTVDLKDKMVPQEVRFKQPITFKRAKFTIRAVYPTSKWDDTALAEVEFYYKDQKIPLDISKFKDLLKVVPEE